MAKKIKMLVIPSDRSGVGFYRSLNPHQYIAEHYSDEFDIDIVYQMPNGDLEAFLKHEINRTKQCACAQCEYERQMYRGLQYVIEAYKELLKKEEARQKRGEK